MPHTVLHLVLALALPPLLLGVIGRTKAAFAGRQGPPVLQPYRDLARLLGKGSVFSVTTTWVFRAGPLVALAAALAAAALVPLGAHPPLVSFAGDLVLFAYLFALGRFFTVAAALDTGSAFPAMGAAREATFACLSEPALFLGLLVFVRRTGSLSLGPMLGGSLGADLPLLGASLVLVLVSLFLVLLAECSRIPVDDPGTHLELTMIHEVMVLDHGGPLLAAVLYGAALKLFVLGALVTRIALPFSTGEPWSDWALFLASMLLLAIGVGAVESVMARLRLVQVPRLLVAACLLSALGIVLIAR